MFVVLVLCMLFRWLTGAAQQEEEEKRQQEIERRKREKEREQKEAAKRQTKDHAKKQFEQAILNGQFPTNEVLAVLANCDGNWDDIPTNVKEAFEELLYGRCTLLSISYSEAVRLIQQRGRIGERAQQRAARAGLPGDDPDRPLGEPEALALLGVSPVYAPEQK